MMQEHHHHQASVGASATHFEHMLNCLKFFEEVDVPNLNVIVKERHTYVL
jgi:hypothetical protein